MRIINIDLSQDTRCPQKVFGGNAREHNESKLVVKLPERMLREDISYYYFEFQTVLGEHIVSPNIYKNELSDGNKISVTLWEQLLPFAGDLNFCVNAVNLAEDNTITIKGKTSICALQILKSPTGDDALIDVNSTKEDLQKAIDDGINEVVKKGIIVGQVTPQGGEIFSTYEGENVNKALSIASSAFGQGTKAGGKGFKITAATKIDDTTGIYTLTSVTGLEAGMEYNVRLTFAKYKCGKILSISGTTITVDGYPNIALSTKQDTDYDKNNYLTIIDRPDLGDIDVGFFTAAFGENCIAQDRSGFVAGRLNTVVGEYGVALGRGNTVGCAGFVAGRENTVLGDMSLTAGQANTATGNVSSALGRQNIVSGTASFVQGFKNTVSGIYSSAFGIQNEVSGNQSIAIGYNNKDLSDSSFVGGASSKVLQGHNVSLVFGTSLLSGAPRQTIFGTFNDSTSSAKFIFGNGTSESNRKNAFEIFEDGTASLQSQGTLDNSITIKKYVDTKVPQNNTPSTYDRVYTTSKKGVQGSLAYSPSAIAGTLAARGANGVLDVGTPTKDTNATTKKYVDDLVSAQVSSVYKAKGSIADISALPTPDKTHEGFVYNIESAFTTTAQFVEGAGKSYPAGANVVIVNTSGTTYKYDVLAGMVDLSGYAKNDTVNNKVDKVSTTSSYDRAYIVNSNGIQDALAISPNLVGNTIAARQKDGQISVGTPTSTDHATPKGYVDDKIAELQAQIGNIQTVLSSLFEGNAVTTQETSQNEIPMVVDDPSNDTNTEVAEEQVAEEEESVE